MHITRLALAVAVLSLTSALYSGSRLRAADVAPASARQALNQSVHELTVEGQSLSKVFDFLRNVSGTNLVVNWTILEQSGITKDTPITLSVREVPLHKVLQLVLNQASPNTQLSFNIDSNVLQITSQDELDKQMMTKVYVVDDLVMVSNNNVQAPTLNLQSITSGSGGSSGGGGGSGFGGGSSGGSMGGGGGSGGGLFNSSTSNNSQPKETSEQKGKALVDLITSVIRPTIWKDNGGNATIRYFNGKLIVTAPASVHEAIGGPVGNTAIRFGS